MNVGIYRINLPALPGVDTDRFNRELDSTNELAELLSCTDIMRQYLDEFYTLYMIDKIYSAKTFSNKVQKVIQTTVSTEVSIFSVAGAIIKALYNVCKWFLTVIGKVWSWFFSFFKRTNKDTIKVIDRVTNMVAGAQNEVVNHAISENEVNAYCDAFLAHCKNGDISPNAKPGTTITEYKSLYYTEFNSRVPTNAKVTNAGELASRPAQSPTSSRLGALGWSSGDKLRNAIGRMDEVEAAIENQLKWLKDQSKEIKRLVDACEANGFVPNKYIEEQGPAALNAACFVTVLVKDVKVLKRLEDRFAQMSNSIEKVCKKYINVA